MSVKNVVLAQRNGNGVDVVLPRTSADLTGYENADAPGVDNVAGALDELYARNPGDTSSLTGRVEALETGQAEQDEDIAALESGVADWTASKPGIVQRVEVLEKKKPYELCEFYYFRHPTLRPGFQPAQGGLIPNAATLYPDAWAYLQTAEGQKLCKTEAEWQAMSTATWYTLADGTTVGWNGIGGVPYYVQDLNAGTLRLPDLRGMYAEASGFDSLGAGGVHGDGSRPITGSFFAVYGGGPDDSAGSGCFSTQTVSEEGQPSTNAGSHNLVYTFQSSRVVPTAAQNQPRAWGALACVYLGQPAS